MCCGSTRVSIVRRGLCGGPARATDRRVELAAGGEHGVADLLGVEPLDGPLPEQSIVGIDPPGRGELRWLRWAAWR